MAKYGPCAVPGWERKIARGQSILPDTKRLPHWNQAQGNALWDVYADFHMIDIPGAPKLGPITPPWVEEVVKYWGGCRDPHTGDRSVQEMLLLTAKKSTKTSSMALLTFAQFIGTKKRNSHAVILATTQEVASMAYNLIAGAIKMDPDLDACYQTYDREMTVKDKRPGWFTQLKVVSADLNVLVGTKAEFIMVDEIHALSAKNGFIKIMEHIRGARAAQKSASCIICTTHPHEVQPGVWSELLNGYRKIRDNESKVARLFVSYEFPKKYYNKGKYLDPKHWKMANPSIGYSTSLKDMVADYEAAIEEGPLGAASFRNQRLNADPEEVETSNSWPGADHWDGALYEDPTLGRAGIEGLDCLLENSEVVTVGIDPGGLYDFCSLYVIGREPDRERWLGWSHHWLHSGVKTRRPAFWGVADGFVALGEVTLVDYGEKVPDTKRSINLHNLAMLLSYINSSGKLLTKHGIGIDRQGHPLILDAIHDDNLPCPIPYHRVFPVPQGAGLAPTIDALGLRVAQGDFVHGGQRIMSWSVRNVEQVPTQQSFRVDKPLDEKRKIDPFIAMCCAARAMECSPRAPTDFKIEML